MVYFSVYVVAYHIFWHIDIHDNKQIKHPCQSFILFIEKLAERGDVIYLFCQRNLSTKGISKKYKPETYFVFIPFLSHVCDIESFDKWFIDLLPLSIDPVNFFLSQLTI